MTINTTGGSSIEYVVIGLKPAASTNFYDWGRATPSNSNGTWSRTPQMPTVNPAPVCTNGVSSKVMWEVKYLIHLTNGTEIQGVLPSRVARVFTGAYCPTGIYPMFGVATSTSTGYTVQITNFDSTYQWIAANAIRSDLTLSGTATSTVSSTGLITVSGLKPAVTASILVTSSKTGVPSQQSAFAATSLSAPPQIDIVVPNVVSGTGTINRTSGTAGSEFIVTFRATDDVGVNDVSGILRNANGEVVVVRGSNQRSSGTALDGIWTVTVTVPTGTPLGQYSIFGRAQDLGNNAGTPNISSEVLIGAIQITG